MEDTSEKRSVSDVPKNYLNLPQNWNENINTSLMVRPVVYCGVKRCYALYHLHSNLTCCKQVCLGRLEAQHIQIVLAKAEILYVL